MAVKRKARKSPRRSKLAAMAKKRQEMKNTSPRKTATKLRKAPKPKFAGKGKLKVTSSRKKKLASKKANRVASQVRNAQDYLNKADAYLERRTNQFQAGAKQPKTVLEATRKATKSSFAALTVIENKAVAAYAAALVKGDEVTAQRAMIQAEKASIARNRARLVNTFTALSLASDPEDLVTLDEAGYVVEETGLLEEADIQEGIEDQIVEEVLEEDFEVIEEALVSEASQFKSEDEDDDSEDDDDDSEGDVNIEVTVEDDDESEDDGEDDDSNDEGEESDKEAARRARLKLAYKRARAKARRSKKPKATEVENTEVAPSADEESELTQSDLDPDALPEDLGTLQVEGEYDAPDETVEEGVESDSFTAVVTDFFAGAKVSSRKANRKASSVSLKDMTRQGILGS